MQSRLIPKTRNLHVLLRCSQPKWIVLLMMALALRRQAVFLQKLNTLDPEAVIRRVDSRAYATNEAVMKEYSERPTNEAVLKEYRQRPESWDLDKPCTSYKDVSVVNAAVVFECVERPKPLDPNAWRHPSHGIRTR